MKNYLVTIKYTFPTVAVLTNWSRWFAILCSINFINPFKQKESYNDSYYFLRIQAPDFDTWLNPDPKSIEQMMTGQGALGHNLHRNLDDPNQVVISMQFADAAAARAFKDWFTPLAAGHDQELLEWWLGEDVSGYSSGS